MIRDGNSIHVKIGSDQRYRRQCPLWVKSRHVQRITLGPLWARFRRRSHDRVEQRRSAPRSLRRWPLHRFESEPFLAAPA